MNCCRCSGTAVNNSKWIGTPVEHHFSTNLSECCALCDAEPWCQAAALL
jgi:hypothetical protein